MSQELDERSAPIAPEPSGAPASAPDWSSITDEFTCPLCGYNLRGLQAPVCPECGHAFEWAAVLHPAGTVHPYLFEHHPERNLTSFLQTLLHQLRPGSFWNTLNPVQLPRVGRLVAYWAVGAALSFIPAVLVIIDNVRALLPWLQSMPPGSPRMPLVLSELWRSTFVRGMVLAGALGALFPWLNYLALRVFGQSMRRARVKPVHVLRCAIYAGDIIIWYALFATAVVAWCSAGSYRPEAEVTDLMLYGAAVALVIHFIRLFFAYRRYIRFPHVAATLVASHLMVMLVIFIVLIYNIAGLR